MALIAFSPTAALGCLLLPPMGERVCPMLKQRVFCIACMLGGKWVFSGAWLCLPVSERIPTARSILAGAVPPSQPLHCIVLVPPAPADQPQLCAEHCSPSSSLWDLVGCQHVPITTHPCTFLSAGVTHAARARARARAKAPLPMAAGLQSIQHKSLPALHTGHIYRAVTGAPWAPDWQLQGGWPGGRVPRTGQMR